MMTFIFKIWHEWEPTFIAAFGVTILATAGSVLTPLGSWYRNLRKPSWQPPDFMFPIAWTSIFILEAASAVIGWHEVHGAAAVLFVGLYILNGVLNILWSFLFFRLQRPDFAQMEVPFLWLSIAAPMVMLYIYAGWTWIFLLPYLLWVSFAAFLNFTIVRLNAPFGQAGSAV
jgi:tryptophan-rich sensory protein